VREQQQKLNKKEVEAEEAKKTAAALETTLANFIRSTKRNLRRTRASSPS